MQCKVHDSDVNDVKGGMALLMFSSCAIPFPLLHSSLSSAPFSLKVYIFEVAGAAISVVIVPGADQVRQTGASVVLSFAGKRNLKVGTFWVSF